MHLEKYELETYSNFMTFEFVSAGPKGFITKRIEYSKMQFDEDVYNLGFGDKKKDGDIDDIVVTDNKDHEKVLATVAASVYVFTHKFPDVWIFVQGSTKSRTRLYQIGITHYFEILNQDFNIYGLLGSKWFDFEKNKNYDGFLINRK